MPTKIEWCDETINPIVGCSKVSEGCERCYAEKMAYRLKRMGHPKYQNVVDKNGWTGKHHADLNPLHELPKKPKKVFVVSMGDLFHENLRDSTIDMIFYAMRDYPQHTYMLLTKRADRMAFYFKKRIDRECVRGIPNLWLGVTVESPKYLPRIDVLLKIHAEIHFVSIEPMLSYMDISEYLYQPPCKDGVERSLIDWVICGPETGPGKRDCNPKWIERIFIQCQAAGIPFFDKTKKNCLAREFPVKTRNFNH